AAEPASTKESASTNPSSPPPSKPAEPPRALAQAWQETIAALRGPGLGGLGIALSGASVRRADGDTVSIGVVPGLVDNTRAFLEDPARSGTFRRELARRLGIDPAELDLAVEASGRPERLTAASAQKQRLDRLMDTDPNLREAVQTLDLRLKE
ncbi:MAG: hypothetical protein ACODAB_07365, partial [Gemmatimonadota bacterium]